MEQDSGKEIFYSSEMDNSRSPLIAPGNEIDSSSDIEDAENHPFSTDQEIDSSSFIEISINPISSGKEIASSSSNPIVQEVGSSSKTQNPKNPYVFDIEIASTNQNPNSSFGPVKCYSPGKVSKTITDPIRRDTYLLTKEIGYSSGCCHVYSAQYSEFSLEKLKLVPSGQVTLMTINKKVFVNESNELQRKIDASKQYRSDHLNLIGINSSFATDQLLCVSLPYMSHGSLRYILSTRPEKKLPEDFIAIVLREVLIVIRDQIHNRSDPRVHKTLSAGDIFVHINNCSGLMSVKLAYEASVYNHENINVEGNETEEASSSTSSFFNPNHIAQWGAAPEVYYGRDNATGGPKSDIWLLGVTALELAYGVLPVKCRADLDRIIKKIKKKKTFPRSLEKLLIVKEKKRKFKNLLNLFKPKEKVFSERFQRMVRKCLSKNPSKRPTAAKLLSSSFFTTERNREKFKQFVLNTENN